MTLRLPAPMDLLLISALLEGILGNQQHEILEAVSLSTTVDNLLSRLSIDGQPPPTELIWDNGKGKSARWMNGHIHLYNCPQYELEVIDGASDLDNLKISHHDSLAQVWTRLTDPVPPSTMMDSTAIIFGQVYVSFYRTLRLPKDGKTYPLPGDLGVLELFDSMDFGTSSESTLKSGVVLAAAFQSEAFWMHLRIDPSTSRPAGPTALRIVANGVNGITGNPDPSLSAWSHDDSRPSVLEPSTGLQSYICTPKQSWLLGLKNSPLEFSQFIAPPISSKSIGKVGQTEQGDFDNLELKFTPSYRTDFKAESNAQDILDLLGTPHDNGLASNALLKLRFSDTKLTKRKVCSTLRDLMVALEMTSTPTLPVVVVSRSLFVISIKTLTGKTTVYSVQPYESVEALKEMIYIKEGIPPSSQRLIFAGKQLADDMSLNDYKVVDGSVVHLILRLRGMDHPSEITLAAEGTFDQKILADPNDPRIWDAARSQVVGMRFLNNQQFAFATGYCPAGSPITEECYRRHGVPWSSLYEEDIAKSGRDNERSSLKDIRIFRQQRAGTGKYGPSILQTYPPAGFGGSTAG